MVASSTFFAVLAATASLVSATQYGNDQARDGEHRDEHTGGNSWQKSDGQEQDGEWQKDDYSQKGYYDADYAYSSVIPSKASSVYSHYSVQTKASYVPSYIPSKASYVSIPSKSNIFSKASYSSVAKSSHVVSYAVPTLITKKSIASSSSKFVDPFAPSSKPADTFVVPVVPYKTSSATKITPAPSASKNATTSARPQTTISLFNAAKGSGNATCASLTDFTYYASVVTANPTATVLALDCSRRGSNGEEQCFDAPKTVTQGPSLFASVEGSKTLSCNIVLRTASASCTEAFAPSGVAGASGSAAPRQSGAVQLGFSGAQICYHPVVVTAGAEKLNSNATVTSRVPTGPSSAGLAATAAPLSDGAGSSAPVASFAGVVAVFVAAFAL